MYIFVFYFGIYFLVFIWLNWIFCFLWGFFFYILIFFSLVFKKKRGRVSAAAAFAGELLGLRPIIHMVDDTTSTIAKVRGDSAVMPGLIVQTKKRMAEGTPYLIGATDDGNAKMLAKMCKKEFGYAPAATFLLGAAVATNTGPNAVAIVYQGEKRR